MNGLQLALYYLQKRARTEQELRDKLTRKQVPPQEIEAVLVRLRQLGYVNDQQYAINYQRARNDYKPMGVRRIKLELQLKGVPKDIVQTISAEKEEELALAREAAEGRLRQYRSLDPEVFRRRMTGFLARRGFGYDTIKQTLSYLEQLGEDHDDSHS